MACMNSTIIKTLKYLIGALTLSKEECNKLIKLIHDLILPRYRIYRKILLIIRYRLKDMIGLGLINLYYKQGFKKLATFLEEINSVSLSGLLLWVNYEAELLIVGIGRDYLFHLDWKTLGVLLLNS